MAAVPGSELWKTLADLRATLAVQDAQLVEQCQIAAREEGRVVERRLGAELADAIAHTQRLQEGAAIRAELLGERTTQLNQAEQRLYSAEQCEQQFRERDAQRKTHQLRLRKIEAEHQSTIEQLREDIRRARGRRAESVSHLHQTTAKEVQECNRISKQNQAVEEDHSLVEDLRERLESGMQLVRTLELSTIAMSEAANEKEVKVDALIQQSIELEEAAEEKDQDKVLQTELMASEQQVLDLSKKATQIQQVDYIAGSLGTQLQESSRLAADLEAAFKLAQDQMDSTELEKEPPESWPRERERMKSELVMLHHAEQEAGELAATLEQELQDLREQHSDYSKRSLCPKDSVNTNDNHVIQRIEHLEDLESQLSKCETENARAKALGGTDRKTLANVEKQLQEVVAATQQAQVAFNAKGRRLQLLHTKCKSNQSMVESHSGQKGISVLTNRAIGLETLITELGSQLDDGERELRQLRFKKEKKEREDQEKDWLHMQLLQAHQQRLDELNAELNCVPNRPCEDGTCFWGNQAKGSPSRTR